MRYEVKQNQAGYKYIEVGAIEHYKPHHKIWINNKIVPEIEDNREFITFPRKGKIIVTEKGNYVLIYGDGNTYVFDIYKKCGYRGMSHVYPQDCDIVLKYQDFDSPQGNLGISEGCLVNTDRPYVIYAWERSGRLYGNRSNGKSRIDINGEIYDLPDDDVEKYL